MLSGQWGGSGEGELRQARMDTEPHAVWGAHRGKDTQTRVSRLSSPCCYIKYGLCKAFHVWQVLSCYAGTAKIPFLTTTLDSLLIFEQLSSAMPCFLCTFFPPSTWSSTRWLIASGLASCSTAVGCTRPKAAESCGLSSSVISSSSHTVPNPSPPQDLTSYSAPKQAYSSRCTKR